MTHRSDDKKAALLSLLGETEGHVNDLEKAWLLTAVTSPASDDISDLWVELFVQEGITLGNRNSMASEWLTSLGYTGSYPAQWAAYWAAGGGGGGGATILVEDTFTDTNGVLLSAHTPDTDTVGSGWIVEQGTPVIVDNKVEANGVDTTFIRCSIDSGKADVIITCDIEVASEQTTQQVILRFTDGNNRWFVQITANTGVEDTFNLLERNASVTTVRATTSGFFVVTGQIVTIRVVASGSTISATLDGGNEISYSGATFNQTVTKHGLGLRGDEIRTADNFKVVDNS